MKRFVCVGFTKTRQRQQPGVMIANKMRDAKRIYKKMLATKETKKIICVETALLPSK